MVEGVWLLRYRMRGVDGSDALLWIHQQVQLRGGGCSADFLWIHQLVQLRGEWQRLFSLDSSARTVEGVGRQRLFALFSSAAKDALIPIKPE